MRGEMNKNRPLFICAAAALLLAAAAVPGAAQTVNLSFNASGNSASDNINGSGTTTLTPGGAFALSFTGLSAHDSSCTNDILFTFNLQSASSTADTLTLAYYVLNGPNDKVSQFSLTGTLNVTAGTGIYAGLGGSGTMTINVSQSATTKTFSVTGTGTVTLGGPITIAPQVTPGGIVPIYSDDTDVEPGSWVSIYGSGFASGLTQWNGDFPTSLGGVSVTVDGKSAFLWIVNSTQINLQLPDDTNLGACVPVVIKTANGTFNTQVHLVNFSPSLNLLGDNQHLAGVILTPNGSGAYGGGTYDLLGPVGAFSFKTRPAKKGETVELFGVGFGPTLAPVPAGQVYTSSSKTQQPVNVFVINNDPNNTQAVGFPVSFAGLVGAGLYQINITIPPNAPSGDLNVGAAVGTQGTNPLAGTSTDVSYLLTVQ